VSGPSYLGQPPGHWVQLLGSEDPIERRLAAYALGELRPVPADVADPLIPALDDPVNFVRVWAAASLARFAPQRGEAVAALVRAAEDAAPFVRSLAAWHLGRLGSAFPDIETSVNALERLLHDGDASVRHEAGLALERLRPETDVEGSMVA
jgi:HEAT repeat protein